MKLLIYHPEENLGATEYARLAEVAACAGRELGDFIGDVLRSEIQRVGFSPETIANHAPQKRLEPLVEKTSEERKQV